MRGRLAGVGFLLILGCDPGGRQPDSLLVADLVESLDLAEIRSETPSIDVGTPQARPHLSRGWSWNERGRSGTTFAWGTGESSKIHFFLARPRDLRLRFRCHPSGQDANPVEHLEIVVNSEPTAEIALRRGWQEYEIQVPTGSLVSGINDLEFRYRRAADAATPATRKARRQTAVAWDWLRFLEIDPPLAPAADGEILTLGPGTQISYFLQVPGASELRVSRIRARGPGEAELEISILRQGETTATLHRVPSSPRESSRGRAAHRWPLTTDAGLVSLQLRADKPVEIHRPRVEAAATAADGPGSGPSGPADTIPRSRPGLILLYLIDTLRADHLSPYHYSRDTSPALSRLAADGVVFEDAQAHSSWTKPTTASILTGHLPWSHGAEQKNDALSGQLPSLAEYLRQAGFATAGFSANGNISATFGFQHGFDHFELMGRFDAPAVEVRQAAMEWLRLQEPPAASFLYLHTIDPHAPYAPTERFFSDSVRGSDDPVGTVPFMRRLSRLNQEPQAELVEGLIDLYDREIATGDADLNALIDELDGLGLYDEALIVVLSDHGEEFYDHRNWTHGRTLYQEVVSIPLLIKFPSHWAAGTRVGETAQQIDILPTILDWIDPTVTPALAGTSLLCAVERAAAAATPAACLSQETRSVYASVHYHHNHWVAVTRGDWKLILKSSDRLDRQEQLFHRPTDPTEQRNLAAEHPVLVGYLASLIRAEMSRPPQSGAAQPVELDEETRRRLEALGYLE